jgi:murein DD-endopeptidase MepM/ murein hydrolase activator NlpD
MVLSPRATARMRTFRLRRWQLVMAALALAGALLGAFSAGATIARAGGDEQLASASGALMDAYHRADALDDTLRALRIAAVASTGSAAAATSGAAPSSAASRARRSALSAAPGVVLPVDGWITSGFSKSRRHPILRVLRAHRGVDIAAPRGTPIAAPAAGRVRFVGRRLGFGLVVEIEHSGGVVTRYSHCASAAVSAGAIVSRGTTVATVGSSGLATGPHLHYEVLMGGRAVDPLRTPVRDSRPAAAADSLIAMPKPRMADTARAPAR